MAAVDVDRVWKVIADLVEGGNREDAEAIKDPKDEYIKVHVTLSFLRGSTDGTLDMRPIPERFNFLSSPVESADREVFVRWDINRRSGRGVAAERGSAVEWHWASFLLNDGPVTQAMVDHAGRCDPEGWKRAAYEVEEEK